MTKLILYKNILPNNDNSIYLCKTKRSLIEYLEQYKVDEIELNNYRINTGVIKIPIKTFQEAPASLNNSNYDEVTYAIVYDSIGSGLHEILTYFRAYHINNALYQSGMAIYNVSVDNWATYYDDFKNIEMTITRCNRNIGLGVYDAVQVTNQRDAIPIDNVIFKNSEDFNILFFANVVTAQRLDGKENVTGLFVLTANVKTLANLVDAEERNARTDFELASRIVSGITALNNGNDVDVAKVYIVPSSVVVKSNYGYELKSKTPYTGNRDLTFTAYIVEPNKEDIYYNLPQLDLNKKYLIGTLTDGLEIPTYTQPISIHYTFICGLNNLQVIVGVGDVEKDITPSFEVGIIGSAQERNAFENISDAMTGLSKVIKMSFGAFTSKTPGVTGLTSGLDFAGSIYEKVDAKGSVPNGNASVNFVNLIHEIGSGYWVGGSDEVLNPFMLTYLTGVDNDIYKRALLFGASFIKVLTIEEVFNYEYITNVETTDKTFIQAIVNTIDNIPKNAQVEIINKIRNGLYLKQ